MFGAWGNPDHDESVAIVHAAIDAGVNFIDTADVYSAGESEEIVAKAIAGRRDDLVIATKVHGPMGADPNMAGNSRRWIMRACEDSLRRLGTDYIDLYYAHFPDPHTPLEQTLLVYDDLVRQGKLRYVALSNHPAWQVVHALWIADDRRLAAAPVGVQVKYNLIDRAAEHELAPACLQFGLSILPSARCTAGSWPAPRLSNGESTEISVSAGPGSPKQSSRLAGQPRG